jgi:quinol monooxygenase YgiN
MSVIMTLRTKADPAAVEAYAAANPETLAQVIAISKEHGVIAHRFYGSDDGQIMVIDEWPDAESFNAFFGASESLIGPMMGAVGASPPEITFWRKLETNDDVGWE